MSGQDHVWILLLLHGESVFFFYICVWKVMCRVVCSSGQDCPLTQKVRTQAESSKPVSVHIHLTHDDSEFLNSGETWTFFSSVIITFSLVRKVPSLRLGLGVTPSRITQDQNWWHLSPEGRASVLWIYIPFVGLGPQMLFSHLQSFIWNIVWTPKSFYVFH